MAAPSEIVRSPGIGLDVDEPRDILLLLDGLREQTRRSETAALLIDTPLGRRLALALAPATVIDIENRKISH